MVPIAKMMRPEQRVRYMVYVSDACLICEFFVSKGGETANGKRQT